MTTWMPREGKNEKLWTIPSSAAAESTVLPQRQEQKGSARALSERERTLLPVAAVIKANA